MNPIKKISQKLILNLVFLLIKEVKGANNLPRHNSYIVASNHASHIDPFIITSLVYKKSGQIMNYIGKKESTKFCLWRFIYNTFDVIPIDRSSKSREPLNIALKRLARQKIIGIFPEGTRAPDGKIHRGKTGVARLILESKSQIVPVAIINSYNLWPRHKKYPLISRIIKINIGKPISFENLSNKKISKKTLRGITNLIMKNISYLHSNL